MHCDDGRLSSLLKSPDATGPDAELAAHLDACPRCQARIQELAGESSWWEEAGDVLRENSLDGPSVVAAPSVVVAAVDPSLPDDVPAACEPLVLDFLSPPSQPELLGRLGRYEIERVIGAGGMGVVLKGFDTELHRPVAIKVLAPHLAGSGAARARFAREARAAAAIVHDHVIPIHDVDSSGKLPYLVMPFVAGRSLQARLDDEGPLGVKDIVRIALQTAQGLAAAHAQGIVHRDVKPANILLEGEVDRVRISDFGLAQAADDAAVTRSGIVAGTPQYMSPEQAQGEPIDHRSDLFSLGSVMYAMGTGRPPFRAEATLAVLRRISESPPRPMRRVNAEIPTWLETVVDRLLAKSPRERFGSAAEVAVLLETCLAHLHQPTVVPLPDSLRAVAPPSVHGRTLRRFAWAAAAAVSLAAIVLLWTARHDERASTQATKPPIAEPAARDAEWNDPIGPAIRAIHDEIDRLDQEI